MELVLRRVITFDTAIMMVMLPVEPFGVTVPVVRPMMPMAVFGSEPIWRAIVVPLVEPRFEPVYRTIVMTIGIITPAAVPVKLVSSRFQKSLHWREYLDCSHC